MQFIKYKHKKPGTKFWAKWNKKLSQHALQFKKTRPEIEQGKYEGINTNLMKDSWRQLKQGTENQSSRATN